MTDAYNVSCVKHGGRVDFARENMEPLLTVENLEKRYERGSLFRAGNGNRVTALAGVSYTEVVAIQVWSQDLSASHGSASSICVGEPPNRDFDDASW